RSALPAARADARGGVGPRFPGVADRPPGGRDQVRRGGGAWRTGAGGGGPDRLADHPAYGRVEAVDGTAAALRLVLRPVLRAVPGSHRPARGTGRPVHRPGARVRPVPRSRTRGGPGVVPP